MKNERFNEISDLELAQMEAEMSGDLQDVRTSATVYAERAWERSERRAERTSAVRRGGWFAWAGAALAAAVLGVGGVRLVHQTSSVVMHATPIAGETVAVAPPQTAANVSDEALLDQIQSDLNTGVPTAMEPLATGSTSTGKHSE